MTMTPERWQQINLILQDTLSSTTSSIRSLYQSQAPLIRFLTALNVPVPDAFGSTSV